MLLSLRSKLTKLHIFLKQILKNIRTNAFNIHAIHLWFANIDIQFILEPYGTTKYYTSYMTKIDKSTTLELHSIIKTYIANNIDANTIIQKLGNAFLNAQQMVVQLGIYLVLYLPLYHSS